MSKKRPTIDLTPTARPPSDDLEKLFAGESGVEQAAGLQLLAIRLEAIEPDPDQPRRTFPDDSLQELSESIRQDGVIQPIEVTEGEPGRYRLVHGERRWRAALLAGLDTIPAIVRRHDYDTITRFVRQLVENIQREDLNDVDRAAALLRLRQLLQEELSATGLPDAIPNPKSKIQNPKSTDPWASQITWAKVGERLGMSRQRIHQLIQLLDLPPEIREAVREGTLSERDTRIYQGLKPVHQRALHRARVTGRLEPDELNPIVRLIKEQPDLNFGDILRYFRQHPAAPTPSVGHVSHVTPQPLAPNPQAVTAAFERLHALLAQIRPQAMPPAGRPELLRLLHLIQEDITSLIYRLSDPAETPNQPPAPNP